MKRFALPLLISCFFQTARADIIVSPFVPRLGVLPATTTNLFQSTVGVEANPRFKLFADGTHKWGPGSATFDVTLARGGVARLDSTASIYPSATTTYDLGSSSNRWNNVYAASLNATSIVGFTATDDVQFRNISAIRSDGTDATLFASSQIATGAARLWLYNGSGTTSSRSTYIRFEHADSNAQKWDVGTNASTSFSIRDAKSGVDTITVAPSTGKTTIGTTSANTTHDIQGGIRQGGASAVNTNSPLVSGQGLSIANDATGVLATSNYNGIVMFQDSNFGNFCLYVLKGGGASTVEVLDSGAKCTTTKDSASSFNVYWDSGSSRYVLQNKGGGTYTFSIWGMAQYNTGAGILQ